MSIVSKEDLKVYAAMENSDNSTNGGLLSSNRRLPEVKNNIFPDTFESERISGFTRYRKIFWKVENIENRSIFAAQIAMSRPTNAQDFVQIALGTQRDTQSVFIASSPRFYSSAKIITQVNIGSNRIYAELESTDTQNTFQDGDSIWIGNNEIEEIHDNITVTIEAKSLIIDLEAGDQIINTNYEVSNSSVCAVMNCGDQTTSFSSVIENSVSGTFDEVTYPITLDNIGTIEQDWTITMVNTNQFTCSGNTIGSIGVGDIDTSYSPINDDFNRPFFTVNTLSWTGSWQSGNTLKFTTHPIAIPIWCKNTIPENCDIVLNNFELFLMCESI